MSTRFIAFFVVLISACKPAGKPPTMSHDELKLRFAKVDTFSDFVQSVDAWVAESYWGPDDTVATCVFAALTLALFYGWIACAHGWFWPLKAIRSILPKRTALPTAKVVER